MDRSWNALRRLWICSLLLISCATAADRVDAASGLQPEDIVRMREMLRDESADTTASNRHADDPRAIEFGRAAFFEPALSRERTRSCASCHDPRRHWTDGRATPDRGIRNTPPLWNLRGALWMGWSGRADSLWGQVLRVVESEHEFDLFRATFLRRIVETPKLDEAYRRAFGPLPKTLRAAAPPCETAADCRDWWAHLPPGSRQEIDDAFVNAAKGIAAFVGGIPQPESRFFALARHPDPNSGFGASPVPLSASEVRGFRLFVGKGQCTFCHHGRTLSDGEFHNSRVRSQSATDDDDRHAGVAALLASPFNLLGRHNDALGRIDHTRYVRPDFALLNSFRTPSLAGIGKTAPYMHDGRFATLADVVDHYSEFKDSAEPGHHENVMLKPLMLSDAEKADLVAFLQSL